MGRAPLFRVIISQFYHVYRLSKKCAGRKCRTLANLSVTGRVMILAGRCPVAQDPGCFLDGIEEDHAENELDEATEF